MTQVLISYAHTDADPARLLTDELTKAGADVHWGQNLLVRELQGAIEAADLFIVLLSPAYLESEWCRREFDVALHRETELRKRFVHVCQVADTPGAGTGLLRPYDWIDLLPPVDHDKLRHVLTVTGIVTPSPESVSQEGEPAFRNRQVELLAALAGRWSGLREELTPQEFKRLTELVEALAAEAIPSRLVRRAGGVTDHLVDVLPDGHPLLLILEEPALRLASVTTDHRELAAWQSAVAALRARLPGAPPEPTVDDVAGGAAGWVLAAESVDERVLRDRGYDPDDPDLLRLTRPGGEAVWPAFQFRQDGLVRVINRILGVADDPWGVADWWLGEHGWLGGRPAELLGVVDDRVLVQAARDERADGDDA
jgi:TIR domain-containing protein